MIPADSDIIYYYKMWIRLVSYFHLMQGWVFSWHAITISNSHWCKYHPCLPINMVLVFMKITVC